MNYKIQLSELKKSEQNQCVAHIAGIKFFLICLIHRHLLEPE